MSAGLCRRSPRVAAGPLGRTICGEPVVLFRRYDGSVAALEDRCGHRRYRFAWQGDR